ncbi:DUF6473 family protein [uncultured Shimia sp.]|uniref:DUF6473 family protein n=1 Tax=uncultured Shimia sp. TaxID=573152 RepID=UPI00260CC9D5|nr:DUF6473 family protein [uncultured Shimia sp.]
MSYEKMGSGALDYMPCRYEDSGLIFRGPERDLDARYNLFVGGTETYGKFMSDPYPALVEQAIDKTCVNFGCINAGVDAFLSDPAALVVMRKAETVFIQVMGAHNMSNRFYRVHPRRNDRFLDASSVMKMVFREIDFTEFHYTRHMLGTLCARAPDRYAMLRDELKQAWVARMRLLLNSIPGRKYLLWFSAHPPSTDPGMVGLGPDPLFVDRGMLDVLQPLVQDVIEVVASPDALEKGSEGMVFSDMEKIAARRLLGPAAHREAAKAIVAELS